MFFQTVLLCKDFTLYSQGRRVCVCAWGCVHVGGGGGVETLGWEAQRVSTTQIPKQ